jgi:hypothetical protein
MWCSALLRRPIDRRGDSRLGTGSDRLGEVGERRGDPQYGWDVDTEFVVAAAEVLDERVSCDDHLCGGIGGQPAHRAEPVFQPTVVGLDRIVNRYERRRCRRCPCCRRRPFCGSWAGGVRCDRPGQGHWE